VLEPADGCGRAHDGAGRRFEDLFEDGFRRVLLQCAQNPARRGGYSVGSLGRPYLPALRAQDPGEPTGVASREDRAEGKFRRLRELGGFRFWRALGDLASRRHLIRRHLVRAAFRPGDSLCEIEDGWLESLGDDQVSAMVVALGGKHCLPERHRHRYEFNNAYLDVYHKAGMIPVGINEKDNLVEIIELKGHPWFIGVQFHPEFKSRPNKAHPIFKSFISAAIENKRNK